MFHSGDAEAQMGSDFFVRSALADQIQHLALAPGQDGVGKGLLGLPTLSEECAQQSAGDFGRARDLAQADVFARGIQAVDAGLARDISRESGEFRGYTVGQ